MRQAVLNIALAALAAGVAHSAKGEPAQLRSVDIPGASRMEIPISRDGFAVERTGARQVDVIIPGATPPFDMTRRFPIAGSRRIASARVVPDEGGIRLRFVLSCECEYAASVSGTYLMIEFRDPAATADPAAHGAELAAAEPPCPAARKAKALNSRPGSRLHRPRAGAGSLSPRRWPARKPVKRMSRSPGKNCWSNFPAPLIRAC